MMLDTTSQAFFEQKYRSDPDPWSFASSSYELGRYQAILKVAVDLAGGRRYRHAFEPGCSIGVLTAKLAAMCDRIDALEISNSAAGKARERCARYPDVKVACGALPAMLPDGPFDLVVFSEIGYYFQPEVLHETATRIVDMMSPGGFLVAAHWLGTSPDHVLSGDHVHSILGEMDDLVLVRAEEHEGFRLDGWRRV